MCARSDSLCPLKTGQIKLFRLHVRGLSCVPSLTTTTFILAAKDIQGLLKNLKSTCAFLSEEGQTLTHISPQQWNKQWDHGPWLIAGMMTCHECNYAFLVQTVSTSHESLLAKSQLPAMYMKIEL